MRRREAGRGKGEVELVLLDHGLYLELSDDFRVRYCRLWKAIVSGDVKVFFSFFCNHYYSCY